MSKPPSPIYSRSNSESMSYEQTLRELNALEKQFHRMEIKRRQKLNSTKYKRTQRLRTEYKIKCKTQHNKEVKQRKRCLENTKNEERIKNANKNERKRESRCKTIGTISTSSTNQHKITNQKRENVLQRKQFLQQQQQQRRKDEFLQKQREREQKIARAMYRKKSSSLRPKSASNSFRRSNVKNKENLNNSFKLLGNEDSSSDLSFSIEPKRYNKNRKLGSAKDIESSSIIEETRDNEKEQRHALKTLYTSNTKKTKKAKKKVHRFMKPTLSAYLLTNHSSSLLASISC